MVIKPLLLAATIAALTGCAVGPDFVKPDTPVPAAFARQDAIDPATQPTSPGDMREFWRQVGDPVLDTLVDDALAANNDLRAALANYDRANALLRGARFDQLPTIRLQGDARETHVPAEEAVNGDRTTKSFQAAAVASWELDLFGRVRRDVEAQRSDAWAAAADHDALQVSIVAEVVRTYVELRGLQTRLRVAHDNVDNQAETLRLVDVRAKAGRDTDFDLERARALLDSTQARIPALEAAEGIAMHRLAVLTGRTPDALIATLATPSPIPAIRASVDGETPASVLRRRPDVAAAEYRLHAATARVGVATADLFPHLTLGALLGSRSSTANALFTAGQGAGLVALGIDWSFLDVGRVRARIRAAGADADAALAQYQQTVLLALEDTENALLTHGRTAVETDRLADAARASTRAAQLARLRYRAGASNLLEVLDADRVRLQAEDALADAQARRGESAVAVFRALAAGWPEHIAAERTKRDPQAVNVESIAAAGSRE
ncbi:efflux transporter outer membrane subunit [Cognatilysobacter terrigena]|uniref:efflux transporter outer membrane subunit n=1 Tax=Cognatilysobacter terrigena TaxID=2488749 RepID=UPI00105D2520|nr:efflux transporter outer membrane subunit [Lysobacter terrigena]